MKRRYEMRPELSHCVIFIVLLPCFAEKTNAFDFLQLLKRSKYTDASSISKPDGFDSPPVLPRICISILKADKNSSLQQSIQQNSTDKPCCFNLDASQKLPNDCLNITQDISSNQTIQADIVNDYEKATNISFHNLTSSGSIPGIDMDNATHYIIWKHFINFTNFVVYHKYMTEDGQQKDSRIKKYLGAHKLLALFLGMAGVLACLLIIIYCVYIRQHKEDTFSHHRLYGEGFEDPESSDNYRGTTELRRRWMT
ncbi:Golgi-associated olfactory signaling regulator isoform X2 [Lithobates pipiens]